MSQYAIGKQKKGKGPATRKKLRKMKETSARRAASDRQRQADARRTTNMDRVAKSDRKRSG